jgi:hypothetical protein
MPDEEDIITGALCHGVLFSSLAHKFPTEVLTAAATELIAVAGTMFNVFEAIANPSETFDRMGQASKLPQPAVVVSSAYANGGVCTVRNGLAGAAALPVYFYDASTAVPEVEETEPIATAYP